MLAAYRNTIYKRISLGLLMYMFIIYIIENSPLNGILGSTILNYVIEPIFWIAATIGILFLFPRIHYHGKSHHRSEVYVWAFNCGVAYLVCSVIGGMIMGFGKSPYSHTFLGVLTNVYMIGTVLIGRECLRGYIVQSFAKHNKMMIMLSFFMTITQIRWYALGNSLVSLKDFTTYMAESVLPNLGNNFLATYLSLYGGAGASLIYMGIIEGIKWLSPILPDLNWFAKGVIGLMVPFLALVYITDAHRLLTKQIKVYREKRENLWVSYLLVAMGVGFLWFVVGVFPLYPAAIATGSMQPDIKPGDVVIIERIKNEEQLAALKVGDVIQYQRENIMIVHRIVEVIENDSGYPSYRTKGDNNSSEDGKVVEASQVKGVLKCTVPKIGWPTLIFKGTEQSMTEEVEF